MTAHVSPSRGIDSFFAAGAPAGERQMARSAIEDALAAGRHSGGPRIRARRWGRRAMTESLAASYRSIA